MAMSIRKSNRHGQLFFLAISTLAVVAIRVAGADEPPVPASDNDIEAKPEGRIAGRVVRDDDSTPVAGAELRLLPPLPLGRSNYWWPFPILRATADANGKFVYDGLTPGRHRVWANHGKLTSNRKVLEGQIVEVPKANPMASVELRLGDGVAVATRVIAKATGDPVAGAVVRAGYGDLDDFRTDEAGRVTLQPLTRERWEIVVWADGFAKQSLWLNIENGRDAELEFELSPGGELEGVVSDPDGEPVEGVFVSARRADDRTGPFVSAKSDAAGYYMLRNAPLDATLEVRVSKLDFVTQSPKVVVTQGKGRFDITVARRPHGGSIQGVVVDGEGRPIADAQLGNNGRDWNEVRMASTGPDGRFLLEDLYHGLYGPDVIVRAKGYAPRRVAVEPGQADAPNDVRIALEPGHRISGRVVDEQSRPLADVWVGYGSDNRRFSLGGNTRTNDEGRFEFDSLPAECHFTFRKDGYSSMDDLSLSLDAEGVTTITMSPHGIVRGKVIDAAGEPVRAFKVRVNSSQVSRSRERSSGLRSDWLNPGQVFEADDGTFEFTDIKLGTPLLMMVEAAGFERLSVDPVKAEDPDRAMVVEFRLKAENASELLTYRGRLVNPWGAPAAAAELRLIVAVDRPENPRDHFPFNWNMIRPGDTASYPNVLRFEKLATDQDGRFEFTRIPQKAQAELVWWGKGVSPGRRDHLERLTEAQREAIEIEVQPAAGITVRIDRKTYPKAAHVHIFTDDGVAPPNLFELKPDQDSLEIADLAPGTYQITLSGTLVPIPGGTGASRSSPLASSKLTLKAGQNQNVEFTVSDDE